MDIRNGYKLCYHFFIFVFSFSFSTLFFCLVLAQIVLSATHTSTSLEHKPDVLNTSEYFPIARNWLDSTYDKSIQFLQILKRRFHNVTTNWCDSLPYAQKLFCLEVTDRSTPNALNWIDNVSHDQSIIGSLPRNVVNMAMQKLRSDCLNACYNDSVANFLFMEQKFTLVMLFIH